MTASCTHSYSCAVTVCATCCIRQLPDFDDVDPVREGKALSRDTHVTEAMSKKRHPLEYVAEDLRARENPYTRLGESSLLLTNFPKGIEVTKKYIQELCLAQEKGAVINRICIEEA